MLTRLIYGYANGISWSRRLERAIYRDLGVRYLARHTHPDHDTICTFRRANDAAVAETFLQVLLLDRTLKFLEVGTVSAGDRPLGGAADEAGCGTKPAESPSGGRCGRQLPDPGYPCQPVG